MTEIMARGTQDEVEGPAQFGVVQYLVGNDLGEARPQESIEGVSAEKSGAPALPRHSITVGARDSFDQAVQAQPAQVVGHLARGHVIGGFAQERGPVASQVAVRKTPRQETKHQ